MKSKVRSSELTITTEFISLIKEFKQLCSARLEDTLILVSYHPIEEYQLRR
ncbi:hypothetical protein KHA80_21160 [Anaerobacillus sp. HL2]|nr:hypothetical protein KHA80_21160 [Anaerobacillus sp. HL2]